MRVPINWLKTYIELEHTPEEFGHIMTKLDSMQDGPIEYVQDEPVVDLEVRQNRPDLLSITGIAIEYAAYTKQDIKYPTLWNNQEGIKWDVETKDFLSIEATDIVKRFTAVQINKVEIKESPAWMKTHLEQYGIPTINNIVDITNYVMLELGIPMHAFDMKKLKKQKGETLLTLRRAMKGENFTTWQGTSIDLIKEDLVVTDSEKLVSIGGITGADNSGITDKTKNIILESANYNQAFIRRTSIRHNLRTDASTRHEKFLNSNMVENAIKRAIFLIKELAGGEIVKIEDYYPNKDEIKTIDLSVNEIERLSGVEIDSEEIKDLLHRLKFTVLDHKESLELGKKTLTVQVPMHRTDIQLEEHLVGEVLRLWGYGNIPFQSINAVPPENITTKSLQLEEKLRNIMVTLGYDEHILDPLVKQDGYKQQIVLENSLNAKKDALRYEILGPLSEVIENYDKYGVKKAKVFEIGKVYYQPRVGEFKEEKQLAVKTSNYEFKELKEDLYTLMLKIGFDLNNLDSGIDVISTNSHIKYKHKNKRIGVLFNNGFEINIDNIIDFVEIKEIPALTIQTQPKQQIEENLSVLVNKNTKAGDVADTIKSVSKKIVSVEYVDTYEGSQIGKDQKAITYYIVIEDESNELTKNNIQDIRSKIL